MGSHYQQKPWTRGPGEQPWALGSWPAEWESSSQPCLHAGAKDKGKGPAQDQIMKSAPQERQGLVLPSVHTLLTQ